MGRSPEPQVSTNPESFHRVGDSRAEDKRYLGFMSKQVVCSLVQSFP